MKDLKDLDVIYAAMCKTCGPVCASDGAAVASRRREEHAGAWPDHATYLASIGFTMAEPDERTKP